jgi:hypothetical protein
MLRRYGKIFVLAALSLSSGFAHAQATPCSEGDQKIFFGKYLNPLIDAMERADDRSFNVLLRELIPRLTPPCQSEVMKRMRAAQSRQPRRAPGGSGIEEGSDGTLYGPGVVCPPRGGCTITQ